MEDAEDAEVHDAWNDGRRGEQCGIVLI